MKHVIAAVFASFALGFAPLPALAKWCNQKAGIPVEEAYQKADLIFVGTPVEMHPTALPNRSALNLGNGIWTGVMDCIPSEDKPYQPKNDCGVSYQAKFKVDFVIKSSQQLFNEVTVNAYNKGYIGFQFEYGERYLVYAWDAKTTVSPHLWASLCARTRPIKYATDDVRYLDSKNIPLNDELKDLIRRRNDGDKQ